MWQLDVVATPAEGVATAPSNGLVPFTRIAREAWCHRLVTTYTVAQANLLSGGTAYNLADSASNLAAASSSLLNGSGTITLTGTSALAADLNTLDGKTTKSVDAASLTDWTGTAAAVLTALNSSGIDGLGNEAVTLTGTTTVADANSVNAAISGQPVTATIREQDMASLAGLTPTGAGVGAQPYTITVSDATVAASTTIDRAIILGAQALAVLDLELPSMEEVTAWPLVTEPRIPVNARATWARLFAKLCSDSVYHKVNPKFWVLWAMFQQAGLCKAPRQASTTRTTS